MRWDPVRDKERAKKIRLLRFTKLEDDCAAKEDKGEEERGKVI